VGVYSGPEITESGLVFFYDFGNLQKSFGTTNISSNIKISIYNNVPGHVTASIIQTSETYQGSPVWQLTLTPTTSTGVSYLTAANNPGIGVFTGGGGGTGGVYTGHSIFFKSTVPLHGPAPIYTHYSNIPGYQTYTTYDDMGDGWYRAHVVWYDSVTRSDSKYWAINPASATLNVPIVIYWAAPFKESQNYTNFVSPYTSRTRGSGNGLVNLAGSTFNGGYFVNAPTYSSANGGSIVFDGINDFILLPSNTYFGVNTTWEAWVYSTGNVSTYNMFMGRYLPYFGFYTGNGLIFSNNIGGNQITIYASGLSLNTWYHTTFTTSYDGTNTTMKIYVNGVETSSIVYGGAQGNYDLPFMIGDGNNYSNSTWYPFAGRISGVKIYNKTLTASEIQQNFNATRSRFAS
jgi:hypothetical protein